MDDAATASNDAQGREEVDAALRRFFVERSRGGLDADSIDASLHMLDAGYLDSMNSLSLLDFIEDRWGIVVPEVELVGRLATLEALVDYVNEKRAPSR